MGSGVHRPPIPFGPSPPNGQWPTRRVLRPLLTPAPRSAVLADRSVPVPRNTRQISRGKLDRFRRTTAGFTRHAFDGSGLRLVLQTRPAMVPRIRFLFISPRLCLPLLSDPASRRRPWGSAILHLHQVGPGLPPGTVEHARHNRDRREPMWLPSSHTTVRTGPYTAVQSVLPLRRCKSKTAQPIP